MCGTPQGNSYNNLFMADSLVRARLAARRHSESALSQGYRLPHEAAPHWPRPARAVARARAARAAAVRAEAAMAAAVKAAAARAAERAAAARVEGGGGGEGG